MGMIDVGIRYEKYCMELLQKKGYTDVINTKASGDQGIDIIAYRDGIKYGFQCKYYSASVGNHAVQEASSGALFYECNVAIVITNTTFTEPAKELAKKIGVVLWERVEMPEENESNRLYMPKSGFVFYYFDGTYDVYTNYFVKENPCENFDFTIELPYLSKRVNVIYDTKYRNGTEIKLQECGRPYSGGRGNLFCNIVIGGKYLNYIFPDIYLPVKLRKQTENCITILRPGMKLIKTQIFPEGKIIKLKRAGYEIMKGLNGSMYIDIIG